jgi:SAM-dependent methyltransferase
MADSDRTKWNERYEDGYAAHGRPSAVLQEWISRIPRGRALDLACGAGRNALFLASHGFEVDAVDISSAALDRARERAHAAGLVINWIEHDLDEPLALAPGYTLILAVRFMNLPLIRAVTAWLAPGGFLVCEEHLVTEAEVAGPTDPAFRVQAGELRELAQGLRVRHFEETLTEDPDQRPWPWRLVAQNPGKSDRPRPGHRLRLT